MPPDVMGTTLFDPRAASRFHTPSVEDNGGTVCMLWFDDYDAGRDYAWASSRLLTHQRLPWVFSCLSKAPPVS